MRNIIIRIVLSATLSASLLCCAFNFTTEKPPDQKQVIEAPILKNLRALIEYIDWSGWRSWGYNYKWPPK